jgi:hypothetical protein
LAASAWVSASRAWSRKARPAAVNSMPCTLRLIADLVFEIADLPAERRLRRVQPLRGRNRQASGLGDRDEIAKVAQLHSGLPYLAGMPLSLQSLFRVRQGRPHAASAAGPMGLVYGF